MIARFKVWRENTPGWSWVVLAAVVVLSGIVRLALQDWSEAMFAFLMGGFLAEMHRDWSESIESRDRAHVRAAAQMSFEAWDNGYKTGIATGYKQGRADEREVSDGKVS